MQFEQSFRGTGVSASGYTKTPDKSVSQAADFRNRAEVHSTVT